MAKPSQNPAPTPDPYENVDAAPEETAPEETAVPQQEPAPQTPDAPEPAARSPRNKPSPGTPKHRFEEFDATKPDGSVVRIRRNIDTGEQEHI